MIKKNIYFFIGTNAEFFKLAPIIKEFKKRKINFKIITSGQNKISFKDISKFTGNVKSNLSFKEKLNKSSLFFFLLWAMHTFFNSIITLKKEFKGINKPNSYFIIHGDTVSSTIGALVAKIYGLKLIHIESGYLSFNFLEPFPEEICRNINIRLADVLFPANNCAYMNLKKIKKTKINTGKNTIIETLQWALKQKAKLKSIDKGKKYYILFLHRQEHVLFRKKWSKKIMNFVINYAPKNLTCIVPNYPITIELIRELGLERKNDKIELIPQLPYIDFIHLMNNAQFITSDSCTLQEETYFLGKPFLALRDVTERSEGLQHNVILCKSNEKIMKQFLDNYKHYQKKAVELGKHPTDYIINYLLQN